MGKENPRRKKKLGSFRGLIRDRLRIIRCVVSKELIDYLQPETSYKINKFTH